MRSLFTLVLLSSACLFAQQPAGDQTPTTPDNNPADTTSEATTTGLAGQFLQGNFVNFYGFANAIYQTAPYVYNNSGSGSWGGTFGGGIDLFHKFETATVSLGYRGEYTDYSGTGYESGSNQNLLFVYAKHLNARWNLSVSANAGIALYGVPYYNPSTPVSNPFSNEDRFLNASLALSYRQTRRLSYAVSGAFFLTRYTGYYGVGTTGGYGALSANYRLTARTTLSGTYSHDAFYYQQGFGSTGVDSVFATIAHSFTRRTGVTLSGGVAHAGGSGTAILPIRVIIDGQPVILDERVSYKESSWVPDFQGSVFHNLGHFTVSVRAGQTVSPGNGVFLASRELFVNGYVSRTWRNSNLSFGGGFIHLVSISNQIRSVYSGSFNSSSFTASYGYRLRRYVSAQAGFSYFSNGSYENFGGFDETRVYFGLTFSSKGIPLTLF